MKILFYLSKILLYISMVCFGFLNFTAFFALVYKYNLAVYGWVILAAIFVSYIGILLFARLKKYIFMFVSSIIFPVTTLVIGTSLKTLPNVKGNAGFNGVFTRNHLLPLFITVCAGLIWFSYTMMPEQRAKRREHDYRRLNPDEKIL